jgi:hypothetical protein
MGIGVVSGVAGGAIALSSDNQLAQIIGGVVGGTLGFSFVLSSAIVWGAAPKQERKVHRRLSAGVAPYVDDHGGGLAVAGRF